jgi:hypothetical protein
MHIKRSFLFFISVASLYLERLQIVFTIFYYLAHYMHDVQDVDEIYSRIVRASIAANSANAKVATVVGSIPAYSETAESEGRQMKQCSIKYF